jgi:hypothetical protein
MMMSSPTNPFIFFSYFQIAVFVMHISTKHLLYDTIVYELPLHSFNIILNTNMFCLLLTFINFITLPHSSASILPFQMKDTSEKFKFKKFNYEIIRIYRIHAHNGYYQKPISLN